MTKQNKINIDIKWTEFKNFFSFGNKWTHFDFKPGINLIIGHNKDNDKSNGSGKTSILESLVFGLYGKTTKDIKKEKIVNWKNRKNCEVKLCFEKDGSEYIIHRGLKPAFDKLYKNGEEIEREAGKLDFQQTFEKEFLGGIDYKTFISILYCNTNSSVNIFNYSKSDKRGFIEKLFGLETYSELMKMCNEKLNTIQQKIIDIVRTNQFNEKTIEDCQKQNIEFKNSLNKFQNFDSEIEKIKKQLEEISAEIKISEIRLNEFNDKESKILKKIEYFTEKNTELDKKIYSSEETLSTLKVEDICFDENSYSKLLTKNIEKSKKIKEISIEKLEKTKDLIEDDLKNTRVSIISWEKSLSQIETKIDELPNLKELENKTQCPLCQQEVDYKKISKDVNVKRDDLKKQKVQIEESLKLTKEKLNENKEKLSDISEKIKEYSDLKNSILILEAEISKLSIAKEKQNENEEKKKDIIKLQENIKKWNKEKEINNIELKKFEKMLTVISNKKEELLEVIKKPEKLKDEIRVLKEKLEIQEEQKKDTFKHIKNNKEKILELKKQNSNNEKEKNKMKVLVDYLEYIKKLCKDENIKQYAISNVIPFLNQQANGYLSDAGFGFYLKLDSWLDAEIKGPGIYDAEFGNLSGGEGRTTNLAMMLSFIDILKLNYSIFPNVLLFDEILDSAIDGSSIEKLFKILKNKQREENLKIYVVSHRKEINEVAFDKIYKVSLENGYSTITEVQ